MTEPGGFNSTIVAGFRASDGEAVGPFAGSDILLLHHTGARSDAGPARDSRGAA